MSRKLIGILFCLITANVVNYAINEWLDQKIPGWTPPQAELDGSSLSTSLAYEKLLQFGSDSVPGSTTPQGKLLKSYYDYLAFGGGAYWLQWRQDCPSLSSEVVAAAKGEDDLTWKTQLLRTLDRTAVCKYGSLILFAITALLFFSGWLKEQYWWTPIYYALIVIATAGLYSFFAAPFFTILTGGTFILYAISLRVGLPIYHYEWVRTLRPFLTLVFFLLGMMAWRGPEWIDYLTWTSPLYRLALLTVVLLTIFFHGNLLTKALEQAQLEVTARILGYAMPLGFTASALGLTLGFYGADTGGSLAALNQELLLFSPEIANNFNPNGPFVLFFAGVALLIIGGIGYFIQRIAR
ncbi:MAG: hypothetical protein AAFU03_15370 [Bacteroidota bacterium]